jgi:hypothetical protein
VKEDFCIFLSSRHKLFKQKYHRCPQGFRPLIPDVQTLDIKVTLQAPSGGGGESNGSPSSSPSDADGLKLLLLHSIRRLGWTPPRWTQEHTNKNTLQKLSKNCWLVALAILKNMSSSMGRIIPYIYIMENKTWLKPPTSYLRIETNKHEAYQIASATAPWLTWIFDIDWLSCWAP